MTHFTMTAALKIQAQQLAEWKTVLNAETFTKLENEVKARNKTIFNNDPYNVFRGQDLTEYVCNQAMRNQRRG